MTHMLIIPILKRANHTTALHQVMAQNRWHLKVIASEHLPLKCTEQALMTRFWCRMSDLKFVTARQTSSKSVPMLLPSAIDVEPLLTGRCVESHGPYYRQ